jgi:hypothetical protein
MRTASALFALCLAAVTVSASVDPPVDLVQHAKGANKVVMGTVSDVHSAFGVNEHGDQLILSQVELRVEEMMKGTPQSTVVFTVEGGTVGNLTLEVSDMQQMERGKRAVLFLTNSSKGDVPHGRSAGVMELNADNRVTGTDLTVDEIRAAVRAAAR